jgi:5'(3')-deoxyribonucleotidase
MDDGPAGLRIGVDMDGVLADFNAGWMARYNSDFGTRLRPDMVVRWDGLHELTRFASMEAFWAWARSDGRSVFRDLPVMPGALAAMRRLAREHRIVIVSSKFEWAIPDSLAWLAEHRFPVREVHFLWRKSAAGCDVYLEDAPHQIEELRGACPQAVVCRRVHPWNDPRPGVEDVRTWAEFEGIVQRTAADRSAM